MEALLKEKEQLATMGTSTQHEAQQTTKTSIADSSENLVKALGEL